MPIQLFQSWRHKYSPCLQNYGNKFIVQCNLSKFCGFTYSGREIKEKYRVFENIIFFYLHGFAVT